MKSRIISLILLLFPLWCYATAEEESERVHIQIEERSQGAIGARLAYKLKECFRKSSRFVESKTATPRLFIYINTLDIGEKGNTSLAAYSVVWTLIKEEGSLPIHVNNTVGYTGSGVLGDAAEGIVAMTDKMMDELRVP